MTETESIAGDSKPQEETTADDVNGTATANDTAASSASSRGRRVSFHSSAKQEDGNSDPFGMSIPRRVKLGKKGANTALRDAFFLFSFVGMLLYFAMNIEVGPTADNKPRKKDKIAIGQQLNKIQKGMATMMMEAVEKTRRKEGCELFTATSSIPEAGLGVFAGRRYLKGEVIYQTSVAAPLSMPDGSVENISSLAWLLKFHPTLSNVENDQIVGGAMQLRTTRTIKGGEELFLPYDLHPLQVLSLHNRPLFGNIPVASDYEMAEDLQKAISGHARQMEVAHARRVQDAVKLNTGYLYSLGASIVSRYAPNVAKLLPASRTELHQRKDLPLHLATLKNKTLSDLQIRGSCLGDTRFQKSEDNTGVVVATRSVKKDETLQVVPVHVFQGTQSSPGTCMASSELKLTVCPLTDIAMAPFGTIDEANVVLKWTDEYLVRGFVTGDLTEAAAGSLTLDLVASKPIENGEKVRISNSRPSLDPIAQ